MKTKIIFLGLGMLVHTALTVSAQNPVYPKPNSINQILSGKQMPPPGLSARDEIITKAYDKKTKHLPYTTFDTVSKQFVVHTPDQNTAQYMASGAIIKNRKGLTAGKPVKDPLGFHLTKDINTSTEASYPSNYSIGGPAGFAVLNNVSYFSADDGINGRELWRSDGTSPGTYMVKNINTSDTGSGVNGVIAANGLLFFSAETAVSGNEPWVSDGTEDGTHLLKDISEGVGAGSYPNQFVNVNGTVFFVTSSFGYNSQLWKTDGTEVGTMPVKDISQTGIGYLILELTAVNDMAYFTAFTWASGFQLFRSDGTDAGTDVVKQIGFYQYEYYAPMQLTSYDNKLYFSVDDGTGRRLWTSDGTFDGTGYAAGFNDVFMQPDYLSIYNNSPFLILNNILFISGYTFADGSGLYKYDASNTDGIVLVKDLTPTFDFNIIVAPDMRLVNNNIYFKVISTTDGLHDELWITNGETDQTQLIKTFGPGEAGVYTYNFFNGDGTLYFVVNNDPAVGTELWKSNGTVEGTVLVSDIFTGKGGAYPENLSFCNGKLLFRATEINTGSELWSSDGSEVGTSLVKDINNATTSGSSAGSFYKGLSSTGNGVVFNAYTPALGGELYKSDGTNAGTVLLNDIATGTDWSFPNSFIFKNNISYFIGDDATGTAIYKSNGTAAGLQRITPYINRDVYYVVNYNIADNGLVFYTVAYRPSPNGGPLELWRSDGTQAGTYMLPANLSYYFDNYAATIGNTVFFIAHDFINGYELWKSDGTIAGTKMVKDINVGYNGSNPYSLFVYKSNIYFGAWDGSLNYSLWKSDGTEKGTVKVKSITPAYYSSYLNQEPQHVFCVSNSTLFFSATDFNSYGAELWKTTGTENGTKLVKNINPLGFSYPNNLTDVNGTLFFTADDGLHGTELWSTNGTTQSTNMVKDITPYFGNLTNLCSAGGKLYFVNNEIYPGPLWSSDGTANGTNPVADAGLTGLSYFSQLTAAGNKLFFGAYSRQYGAELFAGDASSSALNIQSVNRPALGLDIINDEFNLKVYPNPSKETITLNFHQQTNVAVNIRITDIAGRLLLNKTVTAIKGNNTVPLSVKSLPPGSYFIKLNGNESQVKQFVKQE